MPNYSTWSSALANLTTLIQTQVSGLTDGTNNAVLVCEGPPGPNQPDDIIVVGDRVENQAEPHHLIGSMGVGALIEYHTIYVTVDVYRGGDTMTTSRARAYTLANLVDTAVRGDPTLAGAVLISYPRAHRVTQAWDEDAKGTRCVVEIEIFCTFE